MGSVPRAALWVVVCSDAPRLSSLVVRDVALPPSVECAEETAEEDLAELAAESAEFKERTDVNVAVEELPEPPPQRPQPPPVSEAPPLPLLLPPLLRNVKPSLEAVPLLLEVPVTWDSLLV